MIVTTSLRFAPASATRLLCTEILSESGSRGSDFDGNPGTETQTELDSGTKKATHADAGKLSLYLIRYIGTRAHSY